MAESDPLSIREPATVLDHLRTWPQYLLPQRYLSELMFRLARIRVRPWKSWQIRWFARHYGVDMSQAAEPDLSAYPDFNSFFTRALRHDARPLPADDPDALVSPADGQLVAFGQVDGDRLLQAKGRHFSLRALLGGDDRWSETFRGGSFATVYLSPRDYHRVHMPLSGRLTQMSYVPGRLFSVNASTARLVRNLFARNERVIAFFETGFGPMAVVLVGAIFVGSIETVWAGRISPPHGGEARSWHFPADAGQPSPRLETGAELGRFNMGSTVIVLLPAGTVSWDPSLTPGREVITGEVFGRLQAGSSEAML